MSAMEGVEMEDALPGVDPSLHESQDIGAQLLSLYKSSSREDHQHLCAVVGAICQELQDHSLPLTPTSYFAATLSSVDRILSSRQSSPSDPVVGALLVFLSAILPRMSKAVLRSKGESVFDVVQRALASQPEAVSVEAAKAGLKCISHLIVFGEKGVWESVGPAYRLLVDFITDPRPKVQKHSHLCLRDILQSFQGSAILAPASEGIIRVFERFLLLAGGSDPTGSNAGEGPKGAMEVLYILGALKDCLPLMSPKFTTTILKHFKSLLELQQPIVTRHIVTILRALCSSQSSEFAPEVLLDLLCMLASSLSIREKSVDGMTFMAHLLHVGIRKVYALNRQICVVKLPVVFISLGEILACEHEEAIFAAMEALKGLIFTCIDESLIKQGVDQIEVNQEGDARRSGPTIIEKICTTVESFLSYQYSAVWDMAFQVVSSTFNKLGESSACLMRGTIKTLEDMEKLPDEDFTFRKQLHECVGAALGAMGPEIFLRILPLKLDAEDISEANVWLFPILKQYIVGAHLSFFTKSILGLVRLLRQKSQMLEKEGRIASSRSTEALVYSLWSLLPAFCNYPIDTANSFGGLAKALCNALREEPDVRGIICSSLQLLILQNKKLPAENTDLADREISIPEQKARDHYTPKVGTANLNAIRASSPELLSVLSGIFLQSSKDSGGCLQSTISELASISEKKVVKRFFTTSMQKLLKATQEAVQAELSRKSYSMQVDDDAASETSPSLVRAQLLDLAVSLLPGLDAKEVDLLLIAIKPALQDEEGVVQKKAYKTLSIVLKDCEEFLSHKLDDLLELMIEVLPSCHFSAKRHRLESLYFLIVHVFKGASEQKKHDIVCSFLTEIILSLKEANKKTRNRAYDLLVKIGHACGDEECGGKKENLQQFFNMVAGGLAGGTPHMISAAVKGLARLAYEFSDLISAAYNLLPSAFLLLRRKNREIAKANLGLLKVLVAKSQAEGLHEHLRSMVEGLLNWQDDTKNHFKAKIKLLIEMLVKKCGLDAVKAVMPEEHTKLLTNIRKTKERKERRIAAKSEAETRSLHSRASTSRHSRWSHTNIFSDFGDEDADGSDAENMDVTTISGRVSKAASQFNSKAISSRSRQMRRSTKSLPEDLFDEMDDDPLDLLDRQKTRLALRSTDHLKRKLDSDDKVEIAADGRLVIHEDRKPKTQEKALSSDNEDDLRSKAGSHISMRSSSVKAQKRQKTSDSGWAYTGKEYTTKKAGGDVKRKDKLDPYAYWPLDRKMLSRRGEQKAAARKGMASVMKLSKKLEGKSAANALSMKGLQLKRKRTKSSKKIR